MLELVATGSSNHCIAAQVVIALRAVEKDVSTTFTKLGLPTTKSDSRRVLAVLPLLRA